jgi:MoaA/NifB/PqqE/SkfB family radical SAM enzyme
MLRFPLRLTANLTKARFAQRSHPALRPSPVQFVDATELLHHESNHPVSHEKIRELVSSRYPVVWIGGSEPLHHPGVAHLVRAITGSGHFVFLETDGTMLRRRIHEFQPVSRLFLTVRLDPDAQLGTSKSLPPSASELAMEGIRAANLSGFLICVHTRVYAETELGELAEVIQFARSLDVDGMVITPAKDRSKSMNPDAAALQRKTAEARKLIGSKWWESFSWLIEPVLNGEQCASRSAEETVVGRKQEEHSNEAGEKVA